jgi:DNA-binding PadR family transcriptional regulator
VFHWKKFFGNWPDGNIPCPPPIFGPSFVKDMNQLMFLWTISEESNGITGYNLQKIFEPNSMDKPNTTVYRTIKQLEEDELLSVKEQIVNGRAQKIYKINEKGKKRLTDLKQEMQNRIAFFVPLEGLNIPFFQQCCGSANFVDRNLESVENKEKALQLLKYFEDLYKNTKERLTHRITNIEKTLSYINEVADQILKMEEYDPTDILKLFNRLNKDV